MAGINKLWENRSEIEVRELAPEAFWGGRIKVENMEKFISAIKKSAEETNFTYSWFLIGNEYVMTRYPRRAFGPIASIKKHQEALKALESNLSVQGKEETTIPEAKFRVLLWLEEGYAEYQKNTLLAALKTEKEVTENVRSSILELFWESDQQADIKEMNRSQLTKLLSNTDLSKLHSLKEVSTILWDAFNLEEAKIYTVWSWGTYEEPAVLITWNKGDIQKVYKLAEDFHQARIAVEDLQKGQSYMVETKYCSDPDKE